MLVTSTLRFVWNLLRLPFVPLWWIGRLLSRPKGDWVHVRLSHRITEVGHPHPLFRRLMPFFGRVVATPLSSLRRLAVHASRDPRVRGVVFEIPPLAAGWATSNALRRVIASLRASNVRTVAYLPQGGGNRELYVATAADRIVLGPQATFAVLGLSLESRYVKPLLDKLGVHVEAMAQGEYKTAAESVTRDSMSDQQREQLTALLTTIDEELVDAIASRAGLDEATARAVFEKGFFHGQEAVDAKLADAIAYDDELVTKLDPTPDLDKPARLVSAPRYLAFREARFFRRLMRRPYVAVVEVHGAIVPEAPGMGRGGSADPGHLAAALRMARRDRFAVGVVLHVNSPGGSALASDQIHREIVRLREKKPVVTCMGDVAASGGYYVAAPTDAIVADATTITGSIGVVTARVVARELFDTLGIKSETIRMAPHADMLSPSRDMSVDERAIIQRETEGFYRTFVTIVAEGRKRSYDEMEPLARGRVWSGKDAHERGLVDKLGGMEVALDEVRSRLKLPKPILDSLEPTIVRPRRLDVPPAEPPQIAQAAALLLGLSPDVLALLSLVAGGERALYLALGLPRVD